MDKNLTSLLAISLSLLLGCVPSANTTRAVTAAEVDYSRDAIQTLLPFDAIPAIKNPQFVIANEAKLGDDAPVIGVSFNGEQHAYSIYLLNGHEIVNDVVGGMEIATTW
jgi:hypothetical protein